MRFPANRALLWPQLLLMDRLLPEALHAIAWLDGRPLPAPMDNFVVFLSGPPQPQRGEDPPLTRMQL